MDTADREWSALDAGIEVLRVAQQFLDMHEVQSNAVWSRPADSVVLRELLKKTGWQDGWPYCAAFVEACYGTGCAHLGDAALERLVRAKFTPSVMQTYQNVRPLVHQQVPVPGAVFFMQKGTSGLGHEGLVVMAGKRTMATLEGNTSPGVVSSGADREGDGIYLKLRPIDFAPSKGLHLLGFLDPVSSEGARHLIRTYG